MVTRTINEAIVVLYDKFAPYISNCNIYGKGARIRLLLEYAMLGFLLLIKFISNILLANESNSLVTPNLNFMDLWK
jgi:hypothetical protein